MNVSVFIPTYRRPESLPWTLASVLLQRFDGFDAGRLSIVVLNNDLDRAPVERAVQRAIDAVGRGRWEIQIVHRDPPMEPVRSWFGGIRELGAPGDAVFLIGDDDIVLPDALVARCRILEESGADILMNPPYRGTLWFEEGDRAYLAEDAPPLTRCRAGAWSIVGPTELAPKLSAFLGDQTFRLTEGFWDAFDRSMAIMNAVPVQGNQQLANVPYLLPIVASIHGRVAACDVVACIRGMRVRDAVGARFAMTHWQPGLLYAITLEWLERGELGSRADLEPYRAETRSEFARWFVPTLSDPKARRDLARLGRASLREFDRSHGRNLLLGAGMVAKALTGTQHIRHRLQGWGVPLSLASLIARLRVDPAGPAS